MTNKEVWRENLFYRRKPKFRQNYIYIRFWENFLFYSSFSVTLLSSRLAMSVLFFSQAFSEKVAGEIVSKIYQTS